MQKYLNKYPHAAAAVGLPEDELRADLQAVQALIGEFHLDGSRCNRLGVVEGWIAMELRRLTPGLNGPLAASL